MDGQLHEQVERAHRAHQRRGGRIAVALAIPIGVVVSGALVWQASYAAFTATTENTGNSWSTGSVTLADSQSGTALFSASGLSAGTDERCITVTYTGSLAAAVRMTGSITGELANDMTMIVERGTESTPLDATCDGFVMSSAVYSGTADGLAAWLDAPATEEVWAATNPTAHSYRISWTIPDTTAAQGVSATGSFTWTASSS